jgi:hypothetical protein
VNILDTIRDTIRRWRDSRVPPRTYFTILTVQGHDADGVQRLSTRSHVYEATEFTTEKDVYEVAMFDLLAQDKVLVGGMQKAAVLCWYVMTQDVSL